MTSPDCIESLAGGDNYYVVLERTPNDILLKVAVYEVAHIDEDGTVLFALRGGTYRDDVTRVLADAAPLLAGSIDGDGCAALQLVGAEGAIHLCNGDHARFIGEALEEAMALGNETLAPPVEFDRRALAAGLDLDIEREQGT